MNRQAELFNIFTGSIAVYVTINSTELISLRSSLPRQSPLHSHMYHLIKL
jgi:hypothetical protein